MHWLAAILALAAITAVVARRLPRGMPLDTPPPPDTDGDALRLETDELDLHGVVPREAAAVVDEFICDARRRGLVLVKIVHGKGTGVLRRRVRARLARHPDVERWHDATTPGSGWGATVVHLRAADTPLAPAAPPDLV